ncbi:MAG: hypothetical protein HUK21_01160 [Fibrobacteraceae bacterium]|nr:hypothetical protein [Fibrobacteraceae bacterium]
MKYLYIVPVILSILLLVGVQLLIKFNQRPIPRYEPKVNLEEEYFDAEEYLRHLNLKPFNVRSVHRLLLKRTHQKVGVYLESLEPALDTAGLEIVNVYHQILGDDYTPVITSGNDYPYHAKNSKHYFNKAMDFRIVGIPMDKRRKIVETVSERLGFRYFVLWEKGEMEHLHVELRD